MSKSIAPVETAKKILGKKRVLFVEGSNDEQVYSRWLAKIDSLYSAKVELVKTGGRDLGIRAITEMATEANVFALLDRDEWDSTRMAVVTANAPQLLVCEARHCLENYFCAPADIEAILLHQDSAKYSPALPGFTAALEGVRAAWVDHWAMWTTAMRLQVDMMSEGCSKYFHQVVPLPSDADIKARVRTWSTVVDEGRIFDEFDALRTYGRSLPPEEQYRSCIWGKKFFPDVVLPALQQIENRTDWLIDLASWSPEPPADVRVHLQTLLS
jgi:hypothetical protein